MYFCKDYIEEKCEKACTFSIQCSESILKKEFSQTEKNTAKIYCVQGCTMLQSEVLQCFDETYPSCEGFQRCIIQSGILE